MKSWKTTVAGIATILGALAAFAKAYFDGDPSTIPNFEATYVAITVGVGLLLAKDGNVTGGTVPATPEATKRVE